MEAKEHDGARTAACWGWVDDVGLPHLLQLPNGQCSQPRAPANPLASLLPGTLCSCLLQVQGQWQRRATQECICRAHLSPDHVQELGVWPAAPQGPLHPLVLLIVSRPAHKLLGCCRPPSPLSRASATGYCLQTPGLHMPLSRGHINAVQVGHKAAPGQIPQDITSKHWEVSGTLQSN